MNKFNQRGIAHIFIIIAAIGLIGFILLSSSISFRDRLFSQLFPKRESLATTDYGSTPINELDNYPRATNHIQTMVYFGFHTSTIDPVLDYLTKEIDYLWIDQSGLTQDLGGGLSYDFTNVFVYTNDKLKRMNPNMKVGVHAGGAGIMAPYHIPYPYLSDQDFLHDNSGTVLKYSGDPRNTYINISSPATRVRIKDAWINIFTHNQIDGINIDAYDPYVYFNDPSLQNGCLEGPCNSKDFWLNNMIALSQEINNNSPASKDITYNGIFYGASEPTDTMNARFVDYHDGVLSEHAHRMIVQPEIFRAYLNTFDSILAKGKKLFFWVQPQILNLTDVSFSYTNDLNLERFYLASYLLFQQNPLTYFGYHPGKIYDPYIIYFYKDWNLDFGVPLDIYRTVNSPDLYYRQYSNGYAVVNASDNSVDFPFPPGEWREWDPYDSSKGVIGSVPIPPKSGKFFFEASKFPTPSPSPTPSPTPPPKVGDINGDGSVNVVDFSIMLSKWGTADSASDLNGDGIVNVVDFSILLSNWGT